MKPSDLKKLYLKKGVPWLKVNIFGIRYEQNQNNDVFNDILGLATDDDILFAPGTTDPGNSATLNRQGGAAHLCLGYHKDIWSIGIHPRTETEQNKNYRHKAFVQTGTCSIWRDKNRDYDKDVTDPIEKGLFGINMHRASIKGSDKIGPYGEGCQVHQKPDSLNRFLEIAEKSELKTFSYMLFDESEVKKG